jgi:hypothetical protein
MNNKLFVATRLGLETIGSVYFCLTGRTELDREASRLLLEVGRRFFLSLPSLEINLSSSSIVVPANPRFRKCQ